jgi:hypothetical protein
MTVAPALIRAGVALTALVLGGAFLFGLWHIVVGGVIHGNPRAGTFGIVLATATGVALVVLWQLVRRGRGA